MKISNEVIPLKTIKKHAKEMGRYVFVFEIEVGK